MCWLKLVNCICGKNSAKFWPTVVSENFVKVVETLTATSQNFKFRAYLVIARNPSIVSTGVCLFAHIQCTHLTITINMLTKLVTYYSHFWFQWFVLENHNWWPGIASFNSGFESRQRVVCVGLVDAGATVLHSPDEPTNSKLNYAVCQRCADEQTNGQTDRQTNEDSHHQAKRVWLAECLSPAMTARLGVLTRCLVNELLTHACVQLNWIQSVQRLIALITG